MSTDKNRERLSVKTKILYGVCEFGVSMMHSAVQFFLMFYYTDVVGISPAIAGTALLVGKLTWDSINDPLVGLVSDKMQTRFGRRRPFLLLGAIPYGLSVWIVFSMPSGLTGPAAFFAVLFTFLLFDTFHTAISVPYYAMTPELTHDYDERTSLTAYRKIFGVSGYMAGAILIVNGLGGGSIYRFMGAVSGSQARYNGDYGAMLVEATDRSMRLQFINRQNEVIDDFELSSP